MILGKGLLYDCYFLAHLKNLIPYTASVQFPEQFILQHTLGFIATKALTCLVALCKTTFAIISFSVLSPTLHCVICLYDIDCFP
jgi:hypothetical protein